VAVAVSVALGGRGGPASGRGVWLTLGVMPLIYVVGLWSAHEQALIRINLSTDDPASRRRAKGALLHVRAGDAEGLRDRRWMAQRLGGWMDSVPCPTDDAVRRAFLIAVPPPIG
jgi:hypothetical protein